MEVRQSLIGISVSDNITTRQNAHQLLHVLCPIILLKLSILED